MTDYSLSDLNDRLAIPGLLRFSRTGEGPTLAEIATPESHARIALEGGQVLEWTPAGDAPVVWLSPRAVYKPGKSLRGGAPICWPWFGPHATDPALPAHGFARNRPWQVTGAARLPDDAVCLTLELLQDASTQDLWPHNATLTLSVTVGRTLRLALTTHNTGSTPLTLTEAIHTYFQVGDIARVTIEGLDGCAFIDKVDDSRRKTQLGPVTIADEVDRVYADTAPFCVIADPSLARRITIAKSGSRSTVVWNPWIAKTAGFADMDADGYRHMLCVETANALDDGVTLAPGATHTLVAEYALTRD